ncbi:hypothetical protein FRB91_009695 [Serendipita sp. 411]|nr:hypothetical protein FRC15_008832 [Serendipita sp. 397]KAG8827092.1 hypothetical protein FRC19_005520 [Serendipita sp. 401]KAG8837235.1 hypothetical protein FRC18_009755 [Serendipita sp. 400]KAG8858472.1 hypothetical protein FRB91_009695 [Serendipita sp. 411]KAG9056496.1 hypothetical protein FS842_010463 [Serendipita sp. 407]
MDQSTEIPDEIKHGNNTQNRKRHDLRFTPYGTKSAEAERARRDWQLKAKEKRLARTHKAQEPENPSDENGQPVVTPTISALSVNRQHVLDTLKHPGNPLTNAHGTPPVDHVWSCATGHEQNEGRSRISAYKSERGTRLESQREPAKSTLFRGCRIYCNSGYCANTTDLELKQLVAEYGGVVAHTDSGSTHILTSQSLSASKIQQFLTTNARNKKHIVRPEWLFDSISSDKRMREWDYTVIRNSTQGTLNFKAIKAAKKENRKNNIA